MDAVQAIAESRAGLTGPSIDLVCGGELIIVGAREVSGRGLNHPHGVESVFYVLPAPVQHPSLITVLAKSFSMPWSL
jgi:hypothetical protein